MNTLKEILEIIKWPAVALVLGILFMFKFDIPIRGLFSRIRRVGRNWLGLDPEVQTTTETRPSSAEELMRVTDSEALRVTENAIREDLRRRSLPVTPDNMAANVLIRHLAATRIGYDCEYINSVIWGSQVLALEHINSRTDGETREDLRRFYDSASRLYPQVYQRYTFDQWFNFLVNMLLVVERSGRYVITVLGQEFLNHRIRTRRTVLPPY